MKREELIAKMQAYCSRLSNENNVLTEDERLELVRLTRKALAISPELVNSTTDEQAMASVTFANSDDDEFLEQAAEGLGKQTGEYVELLGGLLAEELFKVRKREGRLGQDIIDDEITEATGMVAIEHDLCPDFMRKPIVISMFLSDLIQDPLVLIPQSGRFMELSQRLSSDIHQVSAAKLRLLEIENGG